AGAQALAQNAYITNSGVPPDFFGTVSVIDTTSNTVTATIPVGIAPFGVAVTPPFTPPSCSTGKSWLHFRPPPVDFCCSRLAIGAATERARALAMPAGTRAQALQTRVISGIFSP